jgi:hypothetical protein
MATIPPVLKRLVPDEGIEPPTFGLQNRCSTAELIRPTARLLAFTRFRGGASTADTPRADLGGARAAD